MQLKARQLFEPPTSCCVATVSERSRVHQAISRAAELRTARGWSRGHPKVVATCAGRGRCFICYGQVPVGALGWSWFRDLSKALPDAVQPMIGVSPPVLSVTIAGGGENHS